MCFASLNPKIMKLLLTCTFLSIAFFSSCQNLKDSSSATYVKGNYKIEYPKTWKLDTSNASAVEFTLYSPRENVRDNFSENVNLIIQNLAGQNISLDKYAEISEKQIKTNAVDLHEFSSKKIKTKTNQFYELEYEMTFKAYKLHTIQYYFVENEKAIVLTLTSEINKPDEIKKIGNKILKSFSYKTE